MKTGTVFLVGAGPGDPALLTEQGKTCLEQADVVVYDALACSSVLNLTRPDCELIFAGKTAGNHHKKQSETNQLLAELAQQGWRRCCSACSARCRTSMSASTSSRC